MSNLNAKPFTVLASQLLSPHMRRLTLQGEAIADYPADAEGGYVKLVFPVAGQAKPQLRTYTIAQIDHGCCTMEIDFVRHEDAGPAASWAEQAREGDRIEIAGPGPAKPVNPDHDWVLIAGDMTAFPAIRSNLRRLPAETRGYLLLEVATEEDQAALDLPLASLPAGLELIWLVNAHPGEGKMLSDAIQALEWLPGDAAIWLAGELEEVITARSYLKTLPGVAGERRYISSYWKCGLSEERHKVEKQQRLSA